MHKATDCNPDPRVLEIDNRYINPFGLLIRLDNKGGGKLNRTNRIVGLEGQSIEYP